MLKHVSSTNMVGDFMGVLRSIIVLGRGEPGQRILDLGPHGMLLDGFEFNQERLLSDCIKTDCMLDFSKDGKAIWLNARFCPATDVFAPEGATSFQILYTVLSVPRYGLCSKKKKYVALDGAELFAMQNSSVMLFTDLSMIVNLKVPVQLPSVNAENNCLLCVVGIAFYRGEVLVEKQSSMQLVRVTKHSPGI